jgi:hypothetical protein
MELYDCVLCICQYDGGIFYRTCQQLTGSDISNTTNEQDTNVVLNFGTT